MTTNTRVRILGYIKTNGQARVVELVDALGIGPVAMHRQLKGLIEKGLLVKSGHPPIVFYSLPRETDEEKSTRISQSTKLVEDTFLYIDPSGHLLYGLKGLTAWSKKINKEEQIESLVDQYTKIRSQANAFVSPGGWIDATKRVANTFGNDMALDRVFYQDFYSLSTFGKTRLGQLVLYSKQSQNKQIICQVASGASKIINKLIEHYNIEAIGYIPHSIPRKIQFLKEFAKKLSLPFPEITLSKAYPGNIRVAQKTLSRLADRIENARGTIFVKNPQLRFKSILLIDDAVGSGASLNETAKKIKESGMAKKVYGFAVVGSMKGFEVIREV